MLFKDISPLLADADAFARVVAAMAALAEDVDLVAGVEARGFVVAAPAAHAAGRGFVALRKAGKLPGRTLRASYALEYATAELEVRPDVVPAGARVLLVDDVLATGGTLVAGASLLESCGAQVVRVAVLLEIAALGGRAQLAGREVHALLQA
ncbi:adenine phosphoribosyltransferase [Motilibacter peucedani]|uniref:adenine phosphoribosyltransferase n=1 Tax=Motilibacter peucedani TaxID=598650 RepID=A0A420XS76_9ACTN|nr:adenine phosphoribosyltransferase [Motilibacter peucedani]